MFLLCVCVCFHYWCFWADEGGESSEGDVSVGEDDVEEPQPRSKDIGLKDLLRHRFGNHITNLKLEFSKKKKKGKLPKEARQILLEWWNVHSKWPYPTVTSYFFELDFVFELCRFIPMILWENRIRAIVYITKSYSILS